MNYIPNYTITDQNVGAPFPKAFRYVLNILGNIFYFANDNRQVICDDAVEIVVENISGHDITFLARVDGNPSFYQDIGPIVSADMWLFNFGNGFAIGRKISSGAEINIKTMKSTIAADGDISIDKYKTDIALDTAPATLYAQIREIQNTLSTLTGKGSGDLWWDRPPVLPSFDITVGTSGNVSPALYYTLNTSNVLFRKGSSPVFSYAMEFSCFNPDEGNASILTILLESGDTKKLYVGPVTVAKIAVSATGARIVASTGNPEKALGTFRWA